MNIITVFDTHEEAVPALVRILESNSDVRKRVAIAGNRLEEEYRRRTGYDKEVEELQRKSGQISFVVPGSAFHLPFEEHQKVWADAGKGFELICAIGLGSYDGTYHFSADVVRPDCPTPTENENSSIKRLVDGVVEHLVKESTLYMGAEIKPFLYTVAEDLVLGDDEIQTLHENAKRFTGSGHPLAQIGAMVSSLFASSSVHPVKGLDVSERAEFEKFFNDGQ